MNIHDDYDLQNLDPYDLYVFFDIEKRQKEHARTRNFLRTLTWTESEIRAFDRRVVAINNKVDASLVGRRRHQNFYSIED